MDLAAETPAFLFPAIGLLLFAYKDRYHLDVTLIKEFNGGCESEKQGAASIVGRCALVKERKVFFTNNRL